MGNFGKFGEYRAKGLGARNLLNFLFLMGEKERASERNRTSDLLITNQSLYRLSYAGLRIKSREDKLIEIRRPVNQSLATSDFDPCGKIRQDGTYWDMAIKIIDFPGFFNSL